ncbi:MAG: GTPase ObgE [Candidatus Omnitrophica bacterium]|nr:GTPase ObgE [Candidatus Omnitrophota bacterium]
MFVDSAKIAVQAGKGGNGCNSFATSRLTMRRRPDGGDGGNGGSVIIMADRNIATLLNFRYHHHFRASSGKHGSSNHMRGADGEDCLVRVPPGTIVYDAGNSLLLRDLTVDNDKFIVCRGGDGGRGNSKRRISTEGYEGENKELRFELKLIADVGIIGYPNAGKSTLISRISRAKPKIANYPFTTKEPTLGMVKAYDGSFVVADIPGLIEGAHAGRGLGDRFLRHVERTRILLHLVDVSLFERPDPLKDFYSLNEELRLYSKELIDKPQVIVANKLDLPDSKEGFDRFKKGIKEKVYPISAVTGEGIEELIGGIYKVLKKHKL